MGCWQQPQHPDLLPPQLCQSTSSNTLWGKPAFPRPATLAPEVLQHGVKENGFKIHFLQITRSGKNTQNLLAEQQHVHAFIPNGLHNPVLT